MDIDFVASPSTSPSPVGGPSSPGAGPSSFGAFRFGGRKRRRSTLTSNVSNSSDEDADALPPTFRLRLGSYVSDFPFQTRSQSPLSQLSTQQPVSLPKPSDHHQNEKEKEKGKGKAKTVSTVTSSEHGKGSDADTPYDTMDLDLEVDSSFQAMQVDSPPPQSASTRSMEPSSYFPPQRSSSLSPPATIPALTSSILLSNISTDTKYPDATTRSALPTILTRSNSTGFPSSTLVASRRASRRGSSVLQHVPAAPSPLAHITSFPGAEEEDETGRSRYDQFIRRKIQPHIPSRSSSVESMIVYPSSSPSPSESSSSRSNAPSRASTSHIRTSVLDTHFSTAATSATASASTPSASVISSSLQSESAQQHLPSFSRSRSSSTPPSPSAYPVAQFTTPLRRNSDSQNSPTPPNRRSFRQQRHSPGPPSTSHEPTGGKQMLRFTLGYREDCQMCRDRIPGHFSHVLGNDSNDSSNNSNSNPTQ